MKFFKDLFTHRRAPRDTFMDASNAFDAAYEATEPYTARANRRYEVLVPGGSTADANLNPEIFKPYTEAHLDAHTAAMEALCVHMDKLSAAFASLNSTDAVYTLATSLFNSHCDLYKYAAEGYARASDCAMLDALSGKLRGARKSVDIALAITRAAQLEDATAAAAKASAASKKSRADVETAGFSSLEQKARLAENKAKAFLAAVPNAKS